MKHLLLFTLSSLVASLLADSAVDSLLEKETLEAEHRSATEPKFLDRIASLFGAGTSAPKIQPVKKTGPGVRPQGPYRPPVSPVYRPQAPPPRRQAVAPSYQTPVAVKAPPGHRRQQFVPPSAGLPTRQHLSPVPPLSNQINSQPG